MCSDWVALSLAQKAEEGTVVSSAAWSCLIGSHGDFEFVFTFGFSSEAFPLKVSTGQLILFKNNGKVGHSSADL